MWQLVIMIRSIIVKHLNNYISKWQPTITNTSRLILYVNTKKTIWHLTFDRNNYPKRWFITQIKTQPQTSEQNTFKSFGFKQKLSSSIPKITQNILYNTTHTQFDTLNNFTITNNFREDRLIKLDPNNIRIFYINMNGLNIGNWDYSLLQLCQTFQEKGVDIVKFTETNVHWKRPVCITVQDNTSRHVVKEKDNILHI